MKKPEFMNNLTRKLTRVGFKIKNHSPEILIVLGVAGVVTSTVMACKATTKLSGVLDKAKQDIDEIHDCVEHPENLREEYTVEDSKKDLAIVYTQTGLKLVKLYAPAAILGALSITGIVASHNILRKRNVALAAAYMAEHVGFKEYRGRVIERFGKELDRELKYNIKAKEVEEIVVKEDGTETTVKTTIDVVDPNNKSVYARCFDETCTGWERDAELNLFFLRQQQAHANDLLKERGHLFLNEVYDMLGMQRTQIGQIVGWVYDEKDPIGDNFVDFDIYNLHDTDKRRFVNGYEKSIWLDFNVDGDVCKLLA